MGMEKTPTLYNSRRDEHLKTLDYGHLHKLEIAISLEILTRRKFCKCKQHRRQGNVRQCTLCGKEIELEN